MPKKVYLVRHGESEDGMKELHQVPESPLSPLGIEQAKKTAARFTDIKIDKIHSSPFVRALKTAEIINEIVKKEILQEPLLRELKRPTEVEGQSIKDTKVLSIKQVIKDHADDPTWHYSDEENLSELKIRMRKYLNVLEAETSENILVVSHGVVLKVMFMIAFFGDNAGSDIYNVLYSKFRTTQSGITLMEFKDNGEWKLLTWNDYAHLGEDDNELFYK